MRAYMNGLTQASMYARQLVIGINMLLIENLSMQE